MTAEKLHDALGMLPGDLIAETDALRNRPVKQHIHWSHLSALAACLAVVLFTGALFRISTFRAGSSKGATNEMAMAAPAAADTFAGVEEAPESGAGEWSQDSASNYAIPDAGIESADKTEAAQSALSSSVKVYIDGKAYTIPDNDAIALTDILAQLDYDPARICNCAAEYTIETELGTLYELNLTEGCARCADGQAGLTVKQVETLQEIMEKLENQS